MTPDDPRLAGAVEAATGCRPARIAPLTGGCIAQVYKVQLEDGGNILNTIDGLKAFHERPEDYDLLITDLGLPQINGTLLARQVRQIRDDIPIMLPEEAKPL